MKPPDRPVPGRTDRILGVMGGMLRACALPGQEGVRKSDFGGIRGSSGGFRRAASRNSIYLHPAKRNSAGHLQESKSSIKRSIATYWVNRSLHSSLGDPFITLWILTAGGRGSSRLGLEGRFPTVFLSPAAPAEKPFRAAGDRARVCLYRGG